MAVADTPQTIASKLAGHVRREDCVAWVGSGLSRPAGYPGWADTVRELCDACSVLPLTRAQESSAEHITNKAQECKDADVMMYNQTLARLFARPTVQTRLAYTLLMRIPFRAYVTTNFDPLLANTAAAHGFCNTYAYRTLPFAKIGVDSRPVYYVHGLARREGQQDLVLARSEFEEAYSGMSQSFLFQLLSYHPLIFLGCDLREPEVKALLTRVHDNHKRIVEHSEHSDEPTLPHRAIVIPTRYRKTKDESGHTTEERETDREAEEEDRLRALNVEILRYQPTDEHPEIEEILITLCGLVHRPAYPELKTGFE